MNALDAVYSKQYKLANELAEDFDGRMNEVMTKVIALAMVRLSNATESDFLNYEIVFRDILTEAGYYDLIDQYIYEDFDEFYQLSIEAFKVAGIANAFEQADIQKIEALKRMKRDFFISIGDDAGLKLKQELYRYALTNASMESIAGVLSQSIEDTRLAKYANTYARTSIADFQQELIDLRAGDEGVWVYIGVNDAKTRPFCKHLINEARCYDDEEKLKLQADPKREFNCRHRFHKVSKEWAIKEGYQCQ